MSANVDVEKHLGVRAPRARLSVHKCVCECVCTCAMMGVDGGRQHLVRGRAWQGSQVKAPGGG